MKPRGKAIVMNSRAWQERAATLQEHAASQELHARHARQHGDFEIAVRADGRAILARQRAKKQRRLAVEAAPGRGSS